MLSGKRISARSLTPSKPLKATLCGKGISTRSLTPLKPLKAMLCGKGISTKSFDGFTHAFLQTLPRVNNVCRKLPGCLPNLECSSHKHIREAENNKKANRETNRKAIRKANMEILGQSCCTRIDKDKQQVKIYLLTS